MIKKLAVGAAIATAIISVGAAPASAISTDRVITCSTSGFQGWFDYKIVNNVFYWYYKINKGTNSGGNHANVNIYDGGTNPATVWLSPDAMIQDNVYHPYPTHTRGAGEFSVTFIFDKSNAADPRCTTTL